MPDDTVRIIQRAHLSILETIDQLQLNLRDYPQAKPFLRELHQKLFNHFGHQNESFFVPLKDYGSLVRRDLKMLEFLEFDQKEIMVKLLVFYDQHSGEMDDTNARSFPKDFTDFSSLVLGRFKIEKDYLIPLLEKLTLL